MGMHMKWACHLCYSEDPSSARVWRAPSGAARAALDYVRIGTRPSQAESWLYGRARSRKKKSKISYGWDRQDKTQTEPDPDLD